MVLVSTGFGYRGYWQGRHQTHGLGGGKGKDLGRSGCQPCQLTEVVKEGSRKSFSFSQTPNNCIVCFKDDPILNFISAGCSLLPFFIIFLALCKSSWWAEDLTSIEMLPLFCIYFMDVRWIFEKRQSFSLQVLIFSKSLLAHDD